MLFKTNTKGHKHPSIRLLSKSKTQLVNLRKQKVAFSPGAAHSPEIQSYRTWWGAASPILNDTPVVYTSYNRTRIRNAYIYIYIYILTQSFWTGTKVIRRKHIVQPTGFCACSSTCCQWDGEDVPAPWETPTLLFESKNHMSINLYNIIYAVEEFLISNSKLRNSVIVAIECFLQQLIDAVLWPECIDGPWWFIVACRLNLRGPNLTVVSIGMGHLYVVTLLLMYLNRLTKRSKYFEGCNIYSSIRCARVLIALRTGFLPFLLQAF